VLVPSLVIVTVSAAGAPRHRLPPQCEASRNLAERSDLRQLATRTRLLVVPQISAWQLVHNRMESLVKHRVGQIDGNACSTTHQRATLRRARSVLAAIAPKETARSDSFSDLHGCVHT
jgi:hypothetical protein